MFGWFRRKKAPEPVANTVVVSAAGTASGHRRVGLTLQQAMSIAVEEEHVAGRVDDASVSAAMRRARDLWKQARGSANATGQPVMLDIGTRRLVVEPDQ